LAEAAPPSGRSLLFVSYDGVLGGPGRSQTLPYLRGYAGDGWRVRLLSYEKPELLDEHARRAEVEAELRAMGIPWTTLRWKRSALRDLVQGLRAVKGALREEPASVFHARSYVPALLGWLAAKPRGARLLFDMRGLWPDERVDGGLWSPRNPMFLLWRRIERRLLREADAVVTLSRAGMDLLEAEGRIPRDTPRDVIPCGADLDRFRPDPPGGLPGPLEPFRGKRIYTYLGATGTWYLLDAMLDFGAAATADDPDARLVFLTEDPAGALAEGLLARGVPRDRFLIARAPHAEVPRWLAPSHAGVFFIRCCRSKKASCPTKLAEFLGCGVPVVVNDGVGDMGTLVRSGRVGVVLEGLDVVAFRRATKELAGLHADSSLRFRCRTEAECRLDVRQGSSRFSSLAGKLVRT
jgi:glycosyltransferase involved in cell wall biosynthesis